MRDLNFFHTKSEGTTARDPNKELWSKVLQRAATDFICPPRNENERLDPGWLYSEEDYTGSFNYICEVLGVDKDIVRCGILQLKEKGTYSLYGQTTGYKDGKTKVGRI